MRLLALLLLLTARSSHAARPPPDYRAELHRAVVAQIEALAAEGRVDEALALGARFTKHVEPAAPVLYEVGLLRYQRGELDEALDAYDEALRLDPDLAPARYDRGEILLSQGRIEAAQADLEAAARLRPDHWAAHFRLAEIAARRGDPTALEAHLLDALRQGFELRTLLADPQWKSWAKDPKLGPVIGRFVVAYGDETLWEELRGGP